MGASKRSQQAGCKMDKERSIEERITRATILMSVSFVIVVIGVALASAGLIPAEGSGAIPGGLLIGGAILSFFWGWFELSDARDKLPKKPKAQLRSAESDTAHDYGSHSYHYNSDGSIAGEWVSEPYGSGYRLIDYEGSGITQNPYDGTYTDASGDSVEPG